MIGVGSEGPPAVILEFPLRTPSSYRFCLVRRPAAAILPESAKNWKYVVNSICLCYSTLLLSGAYHAGHLQKSRRLHSP